MDIKNLLILSMVKGIGPSCIKKNRGRILHDNSCESIVQDIKPTELDNLEYYASVSERIISDCVSNDIKIIGINDSAYPRQLLEIGNPPSVLFLKGNESLLSNVIAIIGTRHSTDLGNKIAEKVGCFFSNHFSICNGLVEGIDEHAIYHNGKVVNNVVGIISGGLFYQETCSPKHIRIIDDVLSAGGLIITEFYPYQKEDKYSGSKASRIQAGLSQGLILVQSTLDGGSKYTLSTFSKLPRTLGVIHYPQSKEYFGEMFEANRVIVEKNKSGLASMLELKSDKSIALSSIMPITGKNDYDVFKAKVLMTKTALF